VAGGTSSTVSGGRTADDRDQHDRDRCDTSTHAEILSSSDSAVSAGRRGRRRQQLFGIVIVTVVEPDSGTDTACRAPQMLSTIE
jgi:hypothetical protein